MVSRGLDIITQLQDQVNGLAQEMYESIGQLQAPRPSHDRLVGAAFIV